MRFPSVIAVFCHRAFVQLNTHPCSCFQIVWSNRLKKDRGNDCLITCDGTDFQMPQLGPTFSSHKFKERSGLRYEVALCILTGDIVWIHGPFPCGSYPDISIFHDSLLSHLAPYEQVEADDGYIGESPQYIKCPKSFTNPEETQYMQQRIRNRQETVSGAKRNEQGRYSIAVSTLAPIKSNFPSISQGSYLGSIAGEWNSSRSVHDWQ